MNWARTSDKPALFRFFAFAWMRASTDRRRDAWFGRAAVVLATLCALLFWQGEAGAHVSSRLADWSFRTAGRRWRASSALAVNSRPR